jgi:hypothetical protein
MKQKKTWATEAGILMAVYGALDMAHTFLQTNPVIPEPWGPVILVALGASISVARIIAKSKAIDLAEPRE